MRPSERCYPVRVQGWALSERFPAMLGITALARRLRGYPLWVKGCALGRGLLLSRAESRPESQIRRGEPIDSDFGRSLVFPGRVARRALGRLAQGIAGLAELKDGEAVLRTRGAVTPGLERPEIGAVWSVDGRQSPSPSPWPWLDKRTGELVKTVADVQRTGRGAHSFVSRWRGNSSIPM